jgi:hypothetical protein
LLKSAIKANSIEVKMLDAMFIYGFIFGFFGFTLWDMFLRDVLLKKRICVHLTLDDCVLHRKTTPIVYTETSEEGSIGRSQSSSSDDCSSSEGDIDLMDAIRETRKKKDFHLKDMVQEVVDNSYNVVKELESELPPAKKELFSSVVGMLKNMGQGKTPTEDELKGLIEKSNIFWDNLVSDEAGDQRDSEIVIDRLRELQQS